MRVFLQTKGEELIVSFAGACSSLRDGFRREVAICRAIDSTVKARSIARVLIDFRDLFHIDGVCLRAILVYAGELAIRTRVQIVGPGPALKRLYKLLDSLPALGCYRTIAAARSSAQASISPDAREWRRFADEFDREFGEAVRSEGAGGAIPRPFVIDLQEEAEYLRVEGRD